MMLWSTYTGGGWEKANHDRSVAFFGRAPDLSMCFVTNDFSTMVTNMRNQLTAYKALGVKGLLVAIRPTTGPRHDPALPDIPLSQITAGAKDAVFDELGAMLAASGLTIYIRVGWEMNGDWYPWSGNEEEYRAVVRYVTQRLRAKQNPARPFRFVFCPAGGYGARAADGYYPGDDVITDVWPDYYNSWGAARLTHLETQRQAPAGLNWLIKFAKAHGKTVGVCEFATGTIIGNPTAAYGDEVDWVKGVVGDLVGSGICACIGWWDYAPTSAGEYRGIVSDGALPKTGAYLKQLVATLGTGPIITSVAPALIVNSGATQLTVGGQRLTGASKVLLTDAAKTPLTGLQVKSDSQLFATAPAGVAPGSYEVRVTVPSGTNATSPNLVVQAPATVPVVTGVSPASILNSAARQITVTGSHFTGATAVHLSDGANTACTGLTVASDTQLTCTVPSGVAAGTYDVKVTTAGGTNATSAADLTVTAPSAVPFVSGITPAAVFNDAATAVVITGSGFTGTTAIALDDAGSTDLTGISVIGDTELHATAPAGIARGTYNVRVTSAGGANATSAQKLTVSDPVGSALISGVSPATVYSNAATVITIVGSGLTGATAVRLNDVVETALSGVTVVSDNELQATVPSGLMTGAYGFVVTVPDGHCDSGTTHFTVIDPPTVPTAASVIPAAGSAGKTTLILIVGTGFNGATGVALVGGATVDLEQYVVASDTQITAVVPAGLAAGSYDVVVTTPGGSNATGLVFTVQAYTAPTPPDPEPADPVPGIVTANPARVHVDATSRLVFQGAANRVIEWVVTGPATVAPPTGLTNARGVATAILTPEAGSAGQIVEATARYVL